MAKKQSNKMAGAIGVFFLLFALALLYLVSQSNWIQKQIYPLKYSDPIMKYSGKYQVDPHLVMAIIWTESRYNERATSSRGACGLMQIMPHTGKWAAESIGLESYTDESLYDPQINIQIGCWYLSSLFKQFGNDLNLVLAAYNGGSGNVAKWLKDERYSKDGMKLDYIPFKETREYVTKVLNAYKNYKLLYEL